MKKIINNIKNFIIFAYIIVIILITIFLLSYNDYHIAEIAGTTILPVIDEDLEEFSKGDLLIINKDDLLTVMPNDKVFFYKYTMGTMSVNMATVSTVEHVAGDQYTITVFTSSEDDVIGASEENTYEFSSDYFIGKVDSTISIPTIGLVVDVLESKWGFMFLGVFPSLIFFLWTAYSVFSEVRYADDEDFIDDEEEKPKKKKETKQDKKVEIKEEAPNTEVKENASTSNVINDNQITEKVQEINNNVTEVKQETDNVVQNINITTQNVDNTTSETVVNNVEIKQETKQEVKQEVKIEQKKELTEEQKKALVEAKLKSMSEEQKKALLQAKLNSMTEEQKRALIEAKKKKLEEQKNNK